MDIDRQFSRKIFINPGRHHKRRVEAEDQFAANDLEVERVPAVDVRWVREREKKRTEEGFSAREYAAALSLRLALRRAAREGDRSLLVFFDGVVLRDRFRDRIGEIELPEDWGLFFFGCEHRSRPDVLGRNLVRVRKGGNRCAFAIREPHIGKLLRILKDVGYEKGGETYTIDDALVSLGETIPSYAAVPNFAWIHPDYTDVFDSAGNQKNGLPAVDGVGAEAEGHVPWTPAAVPASSDGPRIAFLFLTVGDVNHSSIWEEYLDGHESHYEIFHHPKEPQYVTSSWLAGRSIDEIHHTAWGDISLVRATNALFRAALEQSDCNFFILVSESCVPVKPLPVLRWALRTEPRSWINLNQWREGKPGEKHKLERIESAGIDLRPYWHFHSQWVALNREAAMAATAEDFTEIFEKVFAADESYYGTVLNFIGYPQDRIARRAITRVEWPDGWSRHPKSFEQLELNQAMNLAFSPHFFARKFPRESNIGQFNLHLNHPGSGSG